MAALVHFAALRRRLWRLFFDPHRFMAVDTAGQARTHLDLKSAQLSVVAMVLKTVDVATVAADLTARSADDPEFFDNDPVLIDLSAVQAE